MDTAEEHSTDPNLTSMPQEATLGHKKKFLRVLTNIPSHTYLKRSKFSVYYYLFPPLTWKGEK